MFESLADRPFWASMLLPLAFMLGSTGCQEPPEELTFSTWTPIVAVPLVDTRFDLGDVLELLGDSLNATPVQGISNGELAFVHEASLTGTLAEEWLVLPGLDEAEAFVLDENVAFALNATLPGEVWTYTDSVKSALDVAQPEGAILTNVELATGQLTFSLNSDLGDDVSGELWIPNLLDPTGLPFSVNWTAEMLANGAFSVQENLSGWRLTPNNAGDVDNEILGIYSFFIENDPNHTAESGESILVELLVEGLTFERVEGDFGQEVISIEESATTLALFDDRFTTSGLSLERASIRVDITNGFGVTALLDSVALELVQDGVTQISLETTAEDLFVAAAQGNAQNPTVASWQVDESNSNVVDFFSADPVGLNLSLGITTNPEALAEGELNFIDSEGFVDANFRVEIPLSIRAVQVDFVDTLDFALALEEEDEVAELDSAELRLILHNGFPFGVDLQAFFLDENGVVLDSLLSSTLSLFSMPVLNQEGLPLAPSEFREDFFFDWERANRLKLANRVVVLAWCSTAEAALGNYVRLTEEQELQMQLGALLYAKIEP